MRLTILFGLGIICLAMTNHTELPESEKDIWVNSRLESMSIGQKFHQSFNVLIDLNWKSEKVEESVQYALQNGVGGIVLKGGTVSRANDAIYKICNASQIPIFIGTEASCGLSESFFDASRFPFPITVGAADSLQLTSNIGALIAQECGSTGFNINFTHLANVYADPSNTQGYLNSFGENPRTVSEHCSAFNEAHLAAGILFTPMDFPGAGDVDFEKNICNNSLLHIDAVDLMPFRSLISSGIKTIGMSSQSYPTLDTSGAPATISKEIINDLLRIKLGFKAVVFSSSLDNESSSFAFKAYMAGCDQLYRINRPKELHDLLIREFEEKNIPVDFINEKCRRVLELKYDQIVKGKKAKKVALDKEWTSKSIYEKGMVVIRNKNEVLPIDRFDRKIALISIGSHVDPLWSSISRTANIDCYHAYSIKEALWRYKGKLNDYDIILTSVHTNEYSTKIDHLDGMEHWAESLLGKQTVLSINGGVKSFKDLDDLPFDAMIISHENHPFALDRMGELLMGCVSNGSKLSVTLSEKLRRGHGVKLPWAGRLSRSHPSVFGISESKLSEIDTIITSGIRQKAFPGCQVLAAYKGKVIYHKNFGYQTYDSSLTVNNNTIYDVASVTKIVSSTAAMMRLQDEGFFNLDDSLGKYLPFVDSTAYESIVIRDMMAHQAGLYPWIPFYVKTMSGGIHDKTLYSNKEDTRFSRQVSTNLWIDPSYEDVMYKSILNKNLGSKKYKYSDLGYYFLRKILTAQTGKSQEEYMQEHFYKPMGLQTIGYNPLNRFSLERIAPTEDDKIFRKELVHGFVHDQGTAMLGGVGGHAGIFSNSWDLAAMMQMFLNGGKYGHNFLAKNVISEYTNCQFCPENRRGAGFDKPVRSLQGGPTCNLVSLSSFGHSGFTGTFVWADPKYDINYVFLSNRVYPDAENWKIVKMNIRSDIQKVIYEAVIQKY